jgi:hypothetical protein
MILELTEYEVAHLAWNIMNSVKYLAKSKHFLTVRSKKITTLQEFLSDGTIKGNINDAENLMKSIGRQDAFTRYLNEVEEIFKTK